MEYTLVNVLTEPLVPGDPNTVLITQENANMLSQLRFADGSSFLSSRYPDFVYQLIAIVAAVGFDNTYAFLTSKVSWLNPHEVLRMSPLTEGARRVEQQELIKYRPIPKEGFYECKYCGSNETVTTEKQSRSGDEAMSQKVQCLSCKRRWTVQ